MTKDNKLDLDLSAEPIDSSEEPKKEPWHPEIARMRLAYWVLGVIAVVFLLSIACLWGAKFGWVDNKLSEDLFEFTKTSLLPIVTLILGFYFGRS